jgi:DNA mismatch repair protein MutL
MNKVKLLNSDITNTIDSNKTITKLNIVVKELIENSIDANAKNINILIKDGGITLIEVRDDGDGISQEDFDKLCSRFNSSKCGDNMEILNTLGFRGEALAILSYISNLTILSKIPAKDFGYEAGFKDGKMIPMSFKAVSCDQGTTIRIANIFQNNAIRKSYYDKSDETKEIINLIQKYGFHFYNISFTLASNTLSDIILKTKPIINSDILSIYKHLTARLYNQEISDNLFYFNNYEKENLLNNITYDCVFTKPSANIDRSNLIIFINNRLVQNQAIKRLIDQTYSKFLIKNGNYFVYLNIKCKPTSIDVNVKGNKSEVYIEDENVLLAQLKLLLEENLNEEISSKNYYVGNYSDLKRKEVNIFKPREDLIEYVYAKDKVRVDTKNISIEKYLEKNKQQVNNFNFDDCLSCIFNEIYAAENLNESLTKIIKNCFYIGYECDNQLGFIQYDTSLYIMNIRTILQEYFLYLILENKLGKFEKLKIKSQFLFSDLIPFFKSNIDPNFDAKNAKINLNEKLHLLNILNIGINSEFQISEIFFIDLGIEKTFRNNFLNNLPLFIYSLIELLNLENAKKLTENENMNFMIEVCKIYSFYLTNIYLQYLNTSDQIANKFLKNFFNELKISPFYIRKNLRENFLTEKIVDTETLYTVFERC